MTDMIQSVYEALKASAQRAPTAIAMRFEGRDFTYAEFVAAVDRAAGNLAQAGIGAQDAVAIYAQNCPEIMMMYYACARIGARFVPVNPALTAEEATYTLTHSKAKRLYFDTRMEEAARKAAAPELLAPIGDLLAKDPGPLPQAAVRAEDDFLIIYTSGSTGQPKAVVLSHGAQIAAAGALAQMWGITAQDRVLVALPLGFLYGLSTASAVALQAGAQVILQRRFHPAEALEAFVATDATAFQGVPTMYSMMLDYAEQQGKAFDLSGMRLMISAGAPLPPELAARFAARFGARVDNYYAMTEVTPIFGRYADDPATLPEGAIGKAAPLAEVRILRADGTDCAEGEEGEFMVRGAATLTRYEGNPEQTAAAMTPEGYFRSGDLGYRDADGFYYISGRIKDIIIRGGANIAPAEVEAVLASHPAVLETAVVGGADRIFGEVPVAFVVTRSGQSVSAEDLIAHAAARLADFKVPKVYHFVTEMPMGKTGKIDKAALKARLAAENGAA